MYMVTYTDYINVAETFHRNNYDFYLKQMREKPAVYCFKTYLRFCNDEHK